LDQRKLDFIIAEVGYHGSDRILRLGLEPASEGEAGSLETTHELVSEQKPSVNFSMH